MSKDNAIRIVKTKDGEGDLVFKGYDRCISVDFNPAQPCNPFHTLEAAMVWGTAQEAEHGIEYFDETAIVELGQAITNTAQWLLDRLLERDCKAVLKILNPYNHEIELEDPPMLITIRPSVRVPWIA
ncbi:hypothetical protein LCGC14_0569470 [marine sediment metagenome]|uniref:Uncharacterized protein n=1 Tax=marine sediment metagenome TaxID=412755 RepID=A0A0F9USU8_9ZZZZ